MWEGGDMNLVNQYRYVLFSPCRYTRDTSLMSNFMNVLGQADNGAALRTELWPWVYTLF